MASEQGQLSLQGAQLIWQENDKVVRILEEDPRSDEDILVRV